MYENGLHRVPYSRVVPCLGVSVLRLRNFLVKTYCFVDGSLLPSLYLTQRDDERKKWSHVYIQQCFN
jgi:hypothetical protein